MILFSSLCFGDDGKQGTPAEILQKWLISLKSKNFANYRSTLHSQSQNVPEYGTKEAMSFWADEIKDLKHKGFKGKFKIVSLEEARNARFPKGSILAYPIVKEKAIKEFLFLIQENGTWKIGRIFS